MNRFENIASNVARVATVTEERVAKILGYNEGAGVPEADHTEGGCFLRNMEMFAEILERSATRIEIQAERL